MTMASSPVEEIDSTSACANGNVSDSGLPGRVENSSRVPSQAAEYTIVLPSGASLAEKIGPRRNVRRAKSGTVVPVVADRRPETYAAATRTAATTAPTMRTPRRRRRAGEGRAGTPSEAELELDEVDTVSSARPRS